MNMRIGGFEDLRIWDVEVESLKSSILTFEIAH
jgi:hypothetical protein